MQGDVQSTGMCIVQRMCFAYFQLKEVFLEGFLGRVLGRVFIEIPDLFRRIPTKKYYFEFE